MIRLQQLYNLIDVEGIDLIVDDIPGRVKGLYFDNIIVLHKNIETKSEENCILAEELGHYYTGVGNLLDQKDIKSIKQENHARKWATEKLISPSRLIDAFKVGVRNRWELSQFLDVTEEFIEESLIHLTKLYGEYFTIDEYTIHFNPLWVYKKFE